MPLRGKLEEYDPELEPKSHEQTDLQLSSINSIQLQSRRKLRMMIASGLDSLYEIEKIRNTETTVVSSLHDLHTWRKLLFRRYHRIKDSKEVFGQSSPGPEFRYSNTAVSIGC